MSALQERTASERYAKCIEASKRFSWDIDRDVLRGREIDITRKFLPDGLSLGERLGMLNSIERRILSQVQGRTYLNMLGLLERFIGAKMLELSRDHGLGDQKALEALVRFTGEELKHQELFRRIELMTDRWMPEGYAFEPQPNDVAQLVLGRSTWSVLALTCLIEIFTQVHYKQSIEPDEQLSPLWKDVLLYHWKEESQHAILDELEWQRENGRLAPAERDQAITDLIVLVAAVDGILQMQSRADCDYFVALCKRPLDDSQIDAIRATVLAAYRWQYIVSGVQEPRFGALLGAMVNDAQAARIGAAVAPIVSATLN